MLWIQNVTPEGVGSSGRSDDLPHDYTVQVNREPPLARFRHVRSLGAAECLRAAADAIDASGADRSFVDGAKVETMLRDFNRLREAIRSHDSFATEAAWEKCERWIGALPRENRK